MPIAIERLAGISVGYGAKLVLEMEHSPFAPNLLAGQMLVGDIFVFPKLI